jgi:LAGLIDADG DNA endonuclease family protein
VQCWCGIRVSLAKTRTCVDCDASVSKSASRCKPCSLRVQWTDPQVRAKRLSGWQADNERRRKPRPVCSECSRQLRTITAHICQSCSGKQMAATNPYFRGEARSPNSRPNEATKVAWRRWTRARWPSPDCLTEEQDQLLLGSLMGDGCLMTRGGAGTWPYFSETHCAAQQSYIAWKTDVLRPFGAKLRPRPPRNNRPGVWQMTTGHQPAFVEYRLAFYPMGIKVVPEIVYARLGALGIAVWLMDDGSVNQKLRNAILSTDCWPLETQVRLCDWFATRWNLHPVPQFQKSKGTYQLRFRVDDTRALLDLVSPFVHPLFHEKWHLADALQWRPAMSRSESAAVMNAKRSALIKAGVFRVGYHTGTVRVTSGQ